MSDPSAPPPPPAAAAPSSNRNVMIVLSYLWLLALIPLLTEKNDREVQWHAKHGLVLTVFEVIFWILLTVLSGMGAMAAGLGCFLGILSPLFALVFIVIHVVCIVKGINGERFMIPGISAFADKF